MDLYANHLRDFFQKPGHFTAHLMASQRPLTRLTDEIDSNLDFYFVNNPQGKDGYRHQAIDSNFAKLIATIKPDIVHIGHLNHLSTGIVDELNKQNIPIVIYSSRLLADVSKRAILNKKYWQ